jgi:type II secretory pathway pseudopilin PulG
MGLRHSSTHLSRFEAQNGIMTIRCGKRLQSGVTLVDVCVALGLLGIMSAGAIGSLRYGLFTMQLARENQRATQVALAKVETIRIYNWNQVTNGTFIPTTFTEDYDPSAPANSRGAVYTGTLTITNFPSNTSIAANMREMIVTLNWTTRDVAHTRTVITYIAKDGMQNYVY